MADDKHPVPETALEHLEATAAIGYLFNAVAHDINNQLTNLILAADQLQHGGGPDAVAAVIAQAQQVAAMTGVVQKIGQANLKSGARGCDPGEVVDEFLAWRRGTGRCFVDELGPVERGMWVEVDPSHLAGALGMLLRGHGGDDRPVSISLAREQRPRTVWSKPGDVIDRAVLRIRVGDGPAPTERHAFNSITDHFFTAERSARDVALMAGYEVVRKHRASVELLGEPGAADREVLVVLRLKDRA